MYNQKIYYKIETNIYFNVFDLNQRPKSRCLFFLFAKKLFEYENYTSVKMEFKCKYKMNENYKNKCLFHVL